MSWVAVIPLKQGGDQKSRLSGVLSASERAALMEGFFRHVLAQLEAAPEIGRVILLSPHRLPECDVEWFADLGRGLNVELEDLRAQLPNADILVVHADLPLLHTSDVSWLAGAAERAGAALAPDRHGVGANAVALLRGEPFRFQFGAGSHARHKASAPHATVVTRRGLSHDVDTPQDLELIAPVYAAARPDRDFAEA